MGEIYTGELSFGAVRKKCVIKVTRQEAIQEQFQSTRHSEETFESHRKKVDERFKRELAITAFVSDNPRVVQALASGSFTSSSGRAEKFLILEFVDGLNLFELKKRYENEIKKPLGAGAVCQIIYQVAKGLLLFHSDNILSESENHDYSHINIIHRDIKPQNLMISLKSNYDENDMIRILDFGVAQVVSHERIGYVAFSVKPEPEFFEYLSIFSYKGTPQYSPYEQFIDPSSIDQTADLYALGCTMFQLLDKGGMPPFPLPCSNETEFKALKNAHQMNKVPNIKLANSGKAINRIIQKMTHKKIPERYPSAKELMADLEKVRKPIELQNVINRLNGVDDVVVPSLPIWKRLNPFKRRTRL